MLTCQIEEKRAIQIIIFLFFVKTLLSSISRSDSPPFKVHHQEESFHIMLKSLKTKSSKESLHVKMISYIFIIFNKISFANTRREISHQADQGQDCEYYYKCPYYNSTL